MAMLQQMAIFFIMVAVGWVARRANIFTAENQPKFSALVANVAGPCLTISCALNSTERISGQETLFVMLVLVILTAIMVGIAALLPILLRVSKDSRRVVNMLFWMTNIGFIGMPLINSVYGSESMIYLTLFLIINNALLYTYGFWCVSGNRKVKMKPRMVIVNPGVIACIVTIIIYFSNIQLPYVITEPINLIGGMTGPLAMMIVGSSLADVSFKHMFGNVKLWIFMLFKMVILPILIILAFKPFVSDPLLLAACMVIIATPSGVMTSIFTSIYDPDHYLLASECIALTTLVSVATLPLVSFVVGV